MALAGRRGAALLCSAQGTAWRNDGLAFCALFAFAASDICGAASLADVLLSPGGISAGSAEVVVVCWSSQVMRQKSNLVL